MAFLYFRLAFASLDYLQTLNEFLICAKLYSEHLVMGTRRLMEKCRKYKEANRTLAPHELIARGDGRSVQRSSHNQWEGPFQAGGTDG